MQQIHTVVDLEVSFDDVFLGDQRLPWFLEPKASIFAE